MIVSNRFLIPIVTVLILVNACFGTPLRRSCGSQLSKRISYICERHGGYNIFLTAGDYRRQRRSIVQECCKNTCTDKDLIQYCRYDSTNEMSSDEAAEMEIPEPVYDYHKGVFPVTKEYSVRMVKSYEGDIVPRDLPPIKVGTVSPEYTKDAVSMILAN